MLRYLRTSTRISGPAVHFFHLPSSSHLQDYLQRPFIKPELLASSQRRNSKPPHAFVDVEQRKLSTVALAPSVRGVTSSEQYLAVILIVPVCMCSALLGVWLTNGDNNVFVQVGLVVLMGLACKNAILIVEFARELEMQGRSIVEAALEACHLRLRPIIMTSIAFIAGSVPLLLGQGAGSEVRLATGVTVFAGMLGVTLFGLFLTPVFYVVLRKLATRGEPERV
nr:efflux RND transporter permease subunit [Pseudomonas lurida]